MSVDEFLARFPEVPRDLRDEAVLAEYVRAFRPLLGLAQKPSPCVAGDGGDVHHRKIRHFRQFSRGIRTSGPRPPNSPESIPVAANASGPHRTGLTRPAARQ
jgi:hypothetical protein